MFIPLYYLSVPMLPARVVVVDHGKVEGVDKGDVLRVLPLLHFHLLKSSSVLLGDPEVTANKCCKSRNLPNTDTQNYTTDFR